MGQLFSFARQHVWASVGMSVGALLTLYGVVANLWDLWQAGMPSELVMAGGLAIFFLSVVMLLARTHGPAETLRKATEESDPDWMEKLTPVVGRHFQQQEVVLDGHFYRNCRFHDVTFVYGGGPFAWEDNDLGAHTLKPATPELLRFVQVLASFGHLKSNLLEPSGPVSAEEWDRRHRISRSARPADQKA